MILDPNSSEILLYKNITFGEIWEFRVFYTLPSDSYYLYFPAFPVAKEDGKTIGRGAAMIEFELINEDGVTKHFTEIPMKEDINIVDTSAFSRYHIGNIGTLLFHDPYCYQSNE